MHQLALIGKSWFKFHPCSVSNVVSASILYLYIPCEQIYSEAFLFVSMVIFTPMLETPRVPRRTLHGETSPSMNHLIRLLSQMDVGGLQITFCLGPQFCNFKGYNIHYLPLIGNLFFFTWHLTIHRWPNICFGVFFSFMLRCTVDHPHGRGDRFCLKSLQYLAGFLARSVGVGAIANCAVRKS